MFTRLRHLTDGLSVGQTSAVVALSFVTVIGAWLLLVTFRWLNSRKLEDNA